MVSDQSDDTPRMRWTYINYNDGKEWSFNTMGYIYHREDLSDLRSPYLEMVQEALKRNSK